MNNLINELEQLNFPLHFIEHLNKMNLEFNSLNDLELYMLEKKYTFSISFNPSNDVQKEFLLYNKLINEGFKKDDGYLFLVKEALINCSFEYFHYDVFKMYNFGLYSKYELYDLLQLSSIVIRTGWKLSNVKSEHLESIAEHMYEMKLLVDMCLDAPQELKDEVSKMVLIHDLVETITGDIPNPMKSAKDELEESLLGKALFANMIYLNIPCGKEYYFLWNKWIKEETLSSKLAHDFDIIQLTYKLLTYTVNFNSFTKENLNLWMKRRPKTEIGMKIYQEIILDNPLFKEVL